MLTRRGAPDHAPRRAKPLPDLTHCVTDWPRRYTASRAQTRKSRRWRVRLPTRKGDPSCWLWRGGLRMPSCACGVSGARKWSSRMLHGVLTTSKPTHWEWFTAPRATLSLRWGALVKTLRQALWTATTGAHGLGANLRSAITTPPGPYWRLVHDPAKTKPPRVNCKRVLRTAQTCRVFNLAKRTRLGAAANGKSKRPFGG